MKSLRLRKNTREAQKKAIEEGPAKKKEPQESDGIAKKSFTFVPTEAESEDDDPLLGSSSRMSTSSRRMGTSSRMSHSRASRRTRQDSSEEFGQQSPTSSTTSTLKSRKAASRQSVSGNPYNPNDLEAAATKAFQDSFFKDEPSEGNESMTSGRSHSKSAPIVVATAGPGSGRPIQSLSRSSSEGSMSVDRDDDDNDNDDHNSMKASLIPETPRRTFYCSCAIGMTFLVAFALINVFSIFVWNPKDLIPDIVNFGDVADGLSSATSSAAGKLSFDDLGDLPPSTLEAIQSRNAEVPQFMAFSWLQADPKWPEYSIDRRRQRFALATLYFATNPPLQHQWSYMGAWLSASVPECHWLQSISYLENPNDPQQAALNLCVVVASTNSTAAAAGPQAMAQLADENGDNMVLNLPLVHNQLVGELPSTELEAMLPDLVKVHLQKNPGLTGQLPATWCSAEIDLKFDCAKDGEGGLCGCDCPC